MLLMVARPRVVSPDETPAIEAKGLTRQFGDFAAVDHVSFKIPRSEIFGFLGSNGCGKSTTMKMLVGFLPATSGTCKLAAMLAIGFVYFSVASVRFRKVIFGG